MTQDFRTLRVWQVAHTLTLEIYRVTANFPRDELYGLTSQVRRASSSIPANIAEGCGRGSDPDLARFLQIAMGSASELEYHLLLARDLRLIDDDDYQVVTDLAIQTKRMLSRFIGRLRGTQQRLDRGQSLQSSGRPDSRQPTADSRQPKADSRQPKADS
jgi:four helix bundle protein